MRKTGTSPRLVYDEDCSSAVEDVELQKTLNKGVSRKAVPTT